MRRDEKRKHELALRSAVISNNADELRRLARDGGDLQVFDIIKRTLLHNAAASGCIQTAMVLVELGMDINAQNVSGETPLYTAIHQGHADVALALIRLGARTDIANVHGHKPLDMTDRSAIARETAAKVQEQISLSGTQRLHNLAMTRRRRITAPGLRP